MLGPACSETGGSSGNDCDGVEVCRDDDGLSLDSPESSSFFLLIL